MSQIRQLMAWPRRSLASRRSRTLAWLAPLLVQVWSAGVADDTVVVPNVNETIDGNGRGSSGVSSARLQQIYPADEFSRIDEPRWITAVAFRPDESVNDPRSPVYDDLAIKLSTTQKEVETLSDVFSENIGPDETIVFEGSLTIETKGGNGPRPHSFDYVYEFDSPFLYDPMRGNLLLELVTCSGRTPSAIEDFDRVLGTTQVGAFDCMAEIATWRVGSTVTQFIFAPLPESDRFLRGDCNADGSVTGSPSDAIFLLDWLFSGGPEPGCLAACDPNSDGVNDLSDAVYVLAFNFNGGLAPSAPFPDCGPLPDGEPLSCETPPEICNTP